MIASPQVAAEKSKLDKLELWFARTQDMGLVREIMTIPAIYRAISDDSRPPIEQYEPPDHPAIWYLLAYDGDDLLGLWVLVPENSICWDVHTCLLPLALGVKGRSVAAARGAIQWVWKNTDCRRLVTKVPAFNRLALRFSRESGMKEYGLNPKSYLKDGALHDQILLGVSR